MLKVAMFYEKTAICQEILNDIMQTEKNVQFMYMVSQYQKIDITIIKNLKIDVLILSEDMNIPTLYDVKEKYPISVIYIVKKQCDARKGEYTVIEDKEMIYNLKQLVRKINSEELSKYVLNELRRFKFNTRTKGYKYLIETLHLAIREPNLLKNVEKELYNCVAIKYTDVTINNVKWNIHKLINSMHLETDCRILKKYFYLDDENTKVSPKHFICGIIENYYNFY